MHTYTRVEPRAHHRKHWLVSCRGSVRCRNTAGAKRAASKHGSCETFQSDRHACIRHGSCAPKAARLVTAVRVGAVWPTCGTSCGASRRTARPSAVICAGAARALGATQAEPLGVARPGVVRPQTSFATRNRARVRSVGQSTSSANGLPRCSSSAQRESTRWRRSGATERARAT